jgi:hypothetical protein
MSELTPDSILSVSSVCRMFFLDAKGEAVLKLDFTGDLCELIPPILGLEVYDFLSGVC